MGNLTDDALYWTRPEDITAARPFYYLPVKFGATDLVGQIIAALASSAALFQESDPAYYNSLMSWALALYGVATGTAFAFSSQLPSHEPVLRCC